MRRPVVASLGVVLAVTLAAACSSSNSGKSTAANGSPASSPQGSAAPSSSLVDAANKEGSLTWYTVFTANDIPKMVAAFNKDYPGIKVNSVRLSSDDIPPRVITEQKGHKYAVDVVEAGSSYIEDMIEADVLQPYTPPQPPPQLNGLDLPAGYPTYIYALTYVVAYNPKILKEDGLPTPTSIEDFTKPAWKGKFSVNSDNVAAYAALADSMGHDKALKLFTDIGNNDPRLVQSATQAITQVMQGDPPATMSALGYTASKDKAKNPEELDFFNPQPLPTAVAMIDLVKNAPHPAAAKLFIDWMVSQKGQQAVVDVTNHTSLRGDVKNDTSVWDPSKWTPAWESPSLPQATLNTYVKELKSALHAP